MGWGTDMKVVCIRPVSIPREEVYMTLALPEIIYGITKSTQMDFNTSKCVILRCSRSPIPILYTYRLNDHVLARYWRRGRTHMPGNYNKLSSWPSSHISKIYMKASHTFNFLRSSYQSFSLPYSSQYTQSQDVKKREYGHWVREVEHVVFTPLMFTSTGGMGREATTFYKHLTDLLATHWGQPYRITIHWLRCHVFFALLCSAILCV